jgi:hypothetical protein
MLFQPYLNTLILHATSRISVPARYADPASFDLDYVPAYSQEQQILRTIA